MTRAADPTWPPERDALVAAPEHHEVLFENERVRVLDTQVAPGETVPAHTHRWPGTLQVVSWSDFVRRDADGNVLLDSRAAGLRLEPGQVIWGDALPLHRLTNVGGSELRVIAVELKEPPRDPSA